MKRLFYIILFKFTLCVICQGNAVNTETFKGLRAVYLRPEILTEEAAETYMADIRRWGAKEVFLEVGYDNKVLDHSSVFPVMDSEKDWFRVLCGKAKKHDLKVHAWVKLCFWVHKTERIHEFPLLIKHPEWIDRNKKGEIVSSQGNYEDRNFVFVNPAIPEVREITLRRLRELCSYDIDGVSLDYIRFKEAGNDPENWYGYNSLSVKRFKEQTGLDPFSIKYDLDPDGDFMKWARYNEQVIEDCVKAISELIMDVNQRKKRNIIISASPFTGYETGKSSKYQNWKPWDEKGFVGLWMPMCMSVDMNELEKEIRGVQNLGLQSPYYPIVYPNQHGMLHPPMKEHHEVLQRRGVDKFAVFSYKQLKQEYENNRNSKESQR